MVDCAGVLYAEGTGHRAQTAAGEKGNVKSKDLTLRGSGRKRNVKRQDLTLKVPTAEVLFDTTILLLNIYGLSCRIL